MTSSPHTVFPPRIRQVAVVVLCFALVAGVSMTVARALGANGMRIAPLLFLVGAPWLLGGLVLRFGRRSPVTFWAAPLLVSLLAPALVIWHDLSVVQSWAHTHGVAARLVTLGINVVLIGGFTLYVRNMFPRCCPECHNWTMIPLRNSWGAESRSLNTRFCAFCGVVYWRTSKGELKKERRRTWLDLTMQDPVPGAGKDQPLFDTESRNISPVVATRRKLHRSSSRAKVTDPATGLARHDGKPI